MFSLLGGNQFEVSKLGGVTASRKEKRAVIMKRRMGNDKVRR